MKAQAGDDYGVECDDQQGDDDQMKRIARFGRFWQYVGVALVVHIATRHASVWGQPDTATEADVASSWIRTFIGVAAAVVVFWTGVYLEGRSAKSSGSLA